MHRKRKNKHDDVALGRKYGSEQSKCSHFRGGNILSETRLERKFTAQQEKRGNLLVASTQRKAVLRTRKGKAASRRVGKKSSWGAA